jgi:hypothetical protein
MKVLSGLSVIGVFYILEKVVLAEHWRENEICRRAGAACASDLLISPPLVAFSSTQLLKLFLQNEMYLRGCDYRCHML